MCKNPKKFGKKAVLVALAAVLGAAVLATCVLAEDVKPSYDRAYFDADKEYLDWWYETEKIIEADKYSLLYARKRDDAKDFYKWSKKLEYDAKTAMGESKQFGDDYVSPKLQLAINKDRLRYEELERAGYHGAGSVEYDSTGYFEECIKNMKMASQYNKESEKIREDWINIIEKDTKILEKEFEKSQESSQQPAQVVKYGKLVATKNGVDVTDTSLDKPVYLYYTQSYGYRLEDTQIITEWPKVIVNGREVANPEQTLGLPFGEERAIGGPYYTYGKVCEAVEKNKNIARGTRFYIGEDISCKREKVITQTKKEPTTIEGQTTTETIYKPTKYDLDDLDENMCSPREYAYIAKTRNGTMYISCRCKPGYTRVRGGCTFDLPIAGVLYVEELERLERVYRALDANEGTAMEITKDGETIKLGVLRRSDYSLLYTLDGETWDSDIAKIVNPSIIDRIGTLWDNIGDAINPVNWFEASYKDKDKQMQYEIAGDTLELYQEDTKKISQYAYEYYSDAKDKKGAIETLLEGKLIKGSAEMAGIETDLLKYTMTFPGVAFTKLVDEAQIQQIANGFFVYAEMRENKTWMSPQEIVNDVMASGQSSWGLDESLGEIILCQLYEESYQRYLLSKTLQAK